MSINVAEFIKDQGDVNLADFHDLHCAVHEVVGMADSDDDIRVAITEILNTLNNEAIFAVRRVAKDLDAAIAWEKAYHDGDMVRVIRTQTAAREPLLDWLARRGVGCND